MPTTNIFCFEIAGYLETQQLQKTYHSFCETSRHLTKEKNGLKYGNKPLDTTQGLVNIIREYFLIKSRINEFLRACPLSPVVIQLIDTNDTLLRLDIILKSFKENLEKAPAGSQKKRKLENDDEEFQISMTNTSTPETVNPPKRLRKSLTTPFLTLSANKDIKVKSVDRSAVTRSEAIPFSSDETSDKEDDAEDDDVGGASRSINSPVSEVLMAQPQVCRLLCNLDALTHFSLFNF